MYDNKYNQIFTEEELSTEVWKDVVGYEGLYKVSSLGRVRSLDRVVTHKNGRKRLFKGKLLTPFKNEYFMVVLSKNGKKSSSNIHRLVAQAFIPNTNNLPEVNHKDEDKTNNRLSNLEWCTRKYNINYGTAIERSVKTRKNNYKNKLVKEYRASKVKSKVKRKKEKALAKKNKKVIMRDIYGYKLREFNTLKEATFYLGKYPQGISTIRSCINGKSYTAYGYVWEYK